MSVPTKRLLSFHVISLFRRVYTLICYWVSKTVLHTYTGLNKLCINVVDIIMNTGCSPFTHDSLKHTYDKIQIRLYTRLYKLDFKSTVSLRFTYTTKPGFTSPILDHPTARSLHIYKYEYMQTLNKQEKNNSVTRTPKLLLLYSALMAHIPRFGY